jgi:hypothetical protein
MPEASSSNLSLVAVESVPARRDCDRRGHAAAAGPGWFESSWDLERGLEVREEWTGEERLHGWIEEFLRAQRAAGRTASPSASTAIA